MVFKMSQSFIKKKSFKLFVVYIVRKVRQALSATSAQEDAV